MVAQVVSVLVWTLIPIHHTHVVARRAHWVVIGTHGRVARIGRRDANHPVDIILYALNKSLNDIDLSWTILN